MVCTDIFLLLHLTIFKMELNEFVPEILCCHLEGGKAEIKLLSGPIYNQFFEPTSTVKASEPSVKSIL